MYGKRFLPLILRNGLAMPNQSSLPPKLAFTKAVDPSVTAVLEAAAQHYSGKEKTVLSPEAYTAQLDGWLKRISQLKADLHARKVIG